MNEVVLPDDILHEIFRQSNGWSVTQCRSVCRRWRDAVDSLNNYDWKKICNNDPFRNEYVTIQRKSGLLWRDVFRAAASWSKIDKADMRTTLLCEGVVVFKVLPGGVVACLQKNKNPTAAGNFCDTIVYYNTKGKQSEKQQLGFNFDAALYDENEHLQVFVLKDKRLCVIVKETKKKYFVGTIEKWDRINNCVEMTLIGKEVYFKNSEDNIIYLSKLTDEKILKTKFLEPFDVIDGDLHFLSDEVSSWRANIYSHKDADLGTIQIDFDLLYLLKELTQYGIDWKSRPLFNYLRNTNRQQTKIFMKNAFYSHGFAVLMASSNAKTIEIHYEYMIYAIEHLFLLLKEKPKRKIVLKDVLPNENETVLQLDIIETLNSHKILALLGKKLYVFEFSHSSCNTTNNVATKRRPGKTTIKAKKANKNSKTRLSKVVKRKSVVAKKKGGKKEKVVLAGRHAYATRSTTTL